MARFSTVKNVTQPLLDPNSGLNILPEGLSFEARATESGGEFTGNIVVAQPRTETGFFQDVFTNFVSNLSLSPKTIAGNIATQAVKSTLASNRPQTPGSIVGRVNMGFFDDVFVGDSLGDNFNAGLSPSPSSFDWSNLLNTGVNILGSAFQGRSQGTPTQFGSNMAMLPAVVRGGGMVARTVGGALSARLASLGLNRATAWTLLKQGGPAALITLGLSAAEVASVARSRGGYRRMNMCNGRALRRASRRLEGFHKFYKRTCDLPVRRYKKKSCK